MQSIQEADLNDIIIFCKSAESKNFTEASINIGVTPSAVSKAISRLESKLNIKLFHRSTRSMRLTEEGRSYHAVCKEAIENIRDIERQISNNIEPSGTIKISMPDSYGIMKFLPAINNFLQKHSNTLNVEVSLSNSYINFTKDEFDLAIRIGDLRDDRLVAKKLNDAVPMLVASPVYIHQYGIPKSIQDLHQHKCIGLHFPHTKTIIPWYFKGQSDPFYYKPSMVHNNSIGAYETVINGFGIMQFFDYAVNKDIQQGKILEILPELKPEPHPIHIVYPSSRYIPAKDRLFMDYIFDVLG